MATIEAEFMFPKYTGKTHSNCLFNIAYGGCLFCLDSPFCPAFPCIDSCWQVEQLGLLGLRKVQRVYLIVMH